MNSIKEDNRESEHQGDGNDLEKMVLQEFQLVHSERQVLWSSSAEKLINSSSILALSSCSLIPW